jgi:hypothetical protein
MWLARKYGAGHPKQAQNRKKNQQLQTMLSITTPPKILILNNRSLDKYLYKNSIVLNFQFSSGGRSKELMNKYLSR